MKRAAADRSSSGNGDDGDEGGPSTKCLVTRNSRFPGHAAVSAGGVDPFAAGHGERRSLAALFQRNPKRPVTSSSNDEADAQVVKDLNEMSLKDREELFEDIHGVLDAVDETEDFIQKKLIEMQLALKWVRNKPAYDQAYFLSPEFVHDRDLRLLMLRSTNYDPAQAAKRLVNHLDFKLKLFGLGKLVSSEIIQDDLTPDMIHELQQAHHQILPQKDRAGRTIVFMASRRRITEDWKSYFGMLWYIFMTALRDADAQKKGIVYIMHNIGVSEPHGQFTRAIIPHAAAFEAACPSKIAVLHFMYDNPKFRPVLSILQMTLCKNNRLRMRAHFGSSIECIYKIMSFGITREMLPVDEHGHLDVASGWQNMTRLREEERERRREADAKAPLIPRPNDVVLGRGYPFQRHPGNVFMASVVELNRSRYPDLKREPKTIMTLGIVKYMQNVHGGRFLKRATEDYKTSSCDSVPDGDCWVLVDNEQARRKAGHCFRAPRQQNQLPPNVPSERYELGGGEENYLMVPVLDPRIDPFSDDG